MLKYSDVKGFLEAGLTSLDYDALPYFSPGPGTDPNIQAEAPDTMVVLTVGSGPGLDSEQIFDQAGIQVRAIGPQQDYDGGEQLAQDIDRLLVAIDHSQNVNNKWTLSVLRTGGPPSMLLKDDGDRYHFTCNYVWEVVY